MSDIHIEVVADNSEEFKRRMKEGVEAALEAIGNQAVSHSTQIITQNIPRHADSWYTPTGNLRNNVNKQVKMEENAVYIGTNVEYAIYNEFGTGKYADGDKPGRTGPWWYQDDAGNWHKTEGMKAIHFLRDSVQGHENEYEGIAKQEIEKHLRGEV